MDAVLGALSEVLQSLVALPVAGINALLDLISGDADAAEAGKPPLETPPIPPEKVSYINASEWRKIADSMDRMPGMTYPAKFARMMIAAWEGGMNEGDGGTIFGVLSATFAADGYDEYLGRNSTENKNLAQQSLDQINDFVERGYFPEAFKRLGVKGPNGALLTNGYEVVKSLIKDPVMLANVMDPVFNHSPQTGGGLLIGAAQEVDGNPKPNYSQKYVSREAIERIAEIGKDPEKRQKFLNILHDHREEKAKQLFKGDKLEELQRRYRYFRDLR